MNRLRRSVLFAAVVAMSFAGCGIENDAAPRPIPESERPTLANPTQAAGPTTGTDRIYLLAPDSATNTGHLRPTQRAVGESADRRLESLFGSLTAAETALRLHTAIPDGLTLHSAVLQASGTLIVDVSAQLLDLTSSTLIDAIAQIVFTASEVQDVQRVSLLVAGKTRQWPAGDGELQTDPLTIYDYPGLTESTQPAFPAVPSPEP